MPARLENQDDKCQECGSDRLIRHKGNGKTQATDCLDCLERDDTTPVTAIILHEHDNRIMCVTRNGQIYLAMWSTKAAALAALQRESDPNWTMVAYETVQHDVLFQTISSGVPGVLKGYVINPNRPDEQKHKVPTLAVIA